MSSWFYNSSSESSNSSTDAQQNSTWSSWTDPVKWQEFMSKTQLDAIKLAEITQREAIKLAEVTQREATKFAEVASLVATEKAAEISKHAQDTRDHYNASDIGGSILYGLGINKTDSDQGGSKIRQVSLEQLDFVYITENVVAMPFPADCRKKKCPPGMNDILDVSSYLEAHHKGHYMVLNISEEIYDYALFDNQVLGKVANQIVYVNKDWLS